MRTTHPDVETWEGVSLETTRTPRFKRTLYHVLMWGLVQFYFRPLMKQWIRSVGRTPGAVRSADSMTAITRLRERVKRVGGVEPLYRAKFEDAVDCPTAAEWLVADETFDEKKLPDPDDMVILYVHGGSFIHARSVAQTKLVENICELTGFRALMVDYRLAPENVWPAALDDVKAAWYWLLELGVPAANIVFLGESTGGGIMLSTLLALRDEGSEMPAAAVALSPWADLTMTGWTMASESFMTGLHVMETCAISAYAYLQGANPWEPTASAVFGDFRDMPPLLVHVSEDEPYFDDARRIAERVRDANGDLTMRIWPAEDHTWQFYGGPAAQRSLEDIAGYILRKVPVKGASARGI